MTDPIRLSKALAQQHNISRSSAEQFIEGGWVTVNGRVEESPQARVGNEVIVLSKDATLMPSLPMTILLHKPAGFDWADGKKAAGDLLIDANRSKADRSGVRLLQRHIKGQESVTPLEFGASGLLIFTQDFPIKRKLWEDAALVENEIIVEVRGDVDDHVLDKLNRPFVVNDRVILMAKVALSKQTEGITGLRFALKAGALGRIAGACEHAGLKVLGMKRIRVGRVPLAGLEVGQWRFLLPHERF
jgi:23S rRNA pseudouridine2604 synthase